jgi:hypothetical protein
MTEAAIPAHLDARRAMPAEDFLKQVEQYDLDGLMDGREQGNGNYARHLEACRGSMLKGWPTPPTGKARIRSFGNWCKR